MTVKAVELPPVRFNGCNVPWIKMVVLETSEKKNHCQLDFVLSFARLKTTDDAFSVSNRILILHGFPNVLEI